MKKLIIATITSIFLLACGFVYAEDSVKQDQDTKALEQRQQMIHHKGSMVMPFDLNKTIHIFQKTATGGELTVKVKDPNDKDQIELIRAHLRKESDLFKKADFSDPKALHGMDMPGLDKLSKSEGKYSVKYNELIDGARLVFTASDPDIIDAIHMWFMAQMMDHGPDAMQMKN